MKLHVSPGNSKLGKTPNLSLPPGKSCVPGVPCLREGCYAMKFYRQYPSVRKAWDENWKLWQKNPTTFFWQLHKWLLAHPKTKRFRYLVGGDIPNELFLRGMVETAVLFPNVKFLSFTKNYALRVYAIPSNLVIVFSRWPGYPCPDMKAGEPQAWMLDEKRKDVYIPETAKKCPGSCVTCSRCFNMKQGGHVVFHKH